MDSSADEVVLLHSGLLDELIRKLKQDIPKSLTVSYHLANPHSSLIH